MDDQPPPPYSVSFLTAPPDYESVCGLVLNPSSATSLPVAVQPAAGLGLGEIDSSLPQQQRITSEQTTSEVVECLEQREPKNSRLCIVICEFLYFFGHVCNCNPLFGIIAYAFDGT